MYLVNLNIVQSSLICILQLYRFSHAFYRFRVFRFIQSTCKIISKNKKKQMFVHGFHLPFDYIPNINFPLSQINCIMPFDGHCHSVLANYCLCSRKVKLMSAFNQTLTFFWIDELVVFLQRLQNTSFCWKSKWTTWPFGLFLCHHIC